MFSCDALCQPYCHTCQSRFIWLPPTLVSPRAMITPSDLVRLPLLWRVAAVFAAVYFTHSYVQARRKAAHKTPLASPPNPSWLFGILKLVVNNPHQAFIFETWAEEFGSVFRVSAPLGSSTVVLADPKAIAHFYAEETWTYVHTRLSRVGIEYLVRLCPLSSRFSSGLNACACIWCSSVVGCSGRKASPIKGMYACSPYDQIPT